MGKGSRQRPTDAEKYNANWERIFGMKESKEQQKDKTPKEPDSKKTK
jgi:hypothetical protein